ncbi:MAG TPA: cobalamin-independent methionine synthase II family protein [Bryobacteraceae bacterium]|nr:cobalamin-independent methionine synthase II family protein [Bryobacteraceae bacterium]
MILSRDRILTTHVGSLPRNNKLSELLIRREEEEAIDLAQLAEEMDCAVRHVVEKQAEAGIDIGNDGEQQRVGFQTYVSQRMSGFAGESKRRRSRDHEEFPALVENLMWRFPKRSRMQNAPEARGELHYLHSGAIQQETARFQKAASEAGVFVERFMTAPSPGIVSTTMLNAWYHSQESYLEALAREMRHEYLAIHEAGLILQIDAPDLAMDRSMFYRDLSEAEFVKAAEMHVAAINKSVDGIPRDRLRLHVCWGNWDGPHIYDVPLELILPVLYQANVGALSIEFANPRHQHEYEALRRHPLPAHMTLLPGVIDTTTNIVEHPEVVARRLQEAVAVVGDRERVIASADCGFGTFTNREWVIEPGVWLKLKAMRQGADLASARLWGRTASVTLKT